MAEKGILIDPALSGTSVACRDAYETDSASNARVIQKVESIGGGRLPDPFIAAANLVRNDITEDGYSIADWTAAGVFTNLLSVGDKNTLVVQLVLPAIYYSSSTLTIQPVLMAENGTTIQGLLSPQSITVLNTAVVMLNSYDAMCAMLTWDLKGAGANKIAIAVTESSDRYYDVYDIYGAVI